MPNARIGLFPQLFRHAFLALLAVWIAPRTAVVGMAACGESMAGQKCVKYKSQYNYFHSNTLNKINIICQLNIYILFLYIHEISIHFFDIMEKDKNFKTAAGAIKKNKP